MSRHEFPNFFSSPNFLNKSLRLFVQPNAPPKQNETVHMDTCSQISLVGAMSEIEIDSQKPRFDVDKDCKYIIIFCCHYAVCFLNAQEGACEVCF